MSIANGFAALLIIVLVNWLTFTRVHPVLFMLNGALAIVVACYMADIINSGVTNHLTVTISVVFIIFGLVNIFLAFRYMFKKADQIG